MLGDDGLKSMTRNAIINANYLKNKLKDAYNIPFTEGTLHEFVVSGDTQKAKGVKALDIENHNPVMLLQYPMLLHLWLFGCLRTQQTHVKFLP
jgi:glycine cleavage system protein P-like pyridoxal-binding family